MASTGFKTAIRDTEREIKGYVEIYNGTNASLKTGGTIATAEAAPSVGEQVIDDIKMPVDYASFEQGFFDDEGMILPNDPTYGDNENIGWISNGVADEDGLFSADQSIKVTLSTTTNTLNGITVYFRHGYPVNFDIILINSADVSTTISVTDNNESVYQYLTAVTNLKSIELQIADWSEPYFRARISEMDFEVSDMYEGNRLIDFQTTEEVSKLSFELPQNELVVNLSNQDGRFDYINPSGIATYLTQGIKMKAHVGVLTDENGIEYVSLGNYYLNSWQNNDDTTTTLTALNLFSLMDRIKSFERYYWIDTMDGYPPITYFEDLMTKWGYSYSDTDWDASTYTEYGGTTQILDTDLPIVSQYEMLKRVATLTGKYPYNLYVDRDDVINFKPIPITSTDNIYLNNMVSNPIFTLKNQLKSVTFLAPSTTQNGTFIEDLVFANNVRVDGTEDIYIVFDNPIDYITFTRTVNVTDATLNSSVDLGYYAIKLNITSTTGYAYVEILGTTMQTTLTQYPYTYNTEGEELEITNELLQVVNFYSATAVTKIYGEAIADNINAYYDNYNISIEWGQDPTIEAGQLITIETPYGDKEMFVEKQVIKYDGGLSGYTEGVGI